MEWTPHWSSRASSVTVSFTFTYHTWQFIIFTITACIFSYSFSILFWTQDLAFQQILSSIDLFLSYPTDSTDSRTIQCFYSAPRLDLFAWCDKLSRLLVGFRTHFKSMHFHFISYRLTWWCLCCSFIMSHAVWCNSSRQRAAHSDIIRSLIVCHCSFNV